MKAFSEDDRKTIRAFGSLVLRATHTEEETDAMRLETPIGPPALAALRKHRHDLGHRLSARIPCRALTVARNILACGEDLMEKYEARRADRVRDLGLGLREYVAELATASTDEA